MSRENKYGIQFFWTYMMIYLV